MTGFARGSKITPLGRLEIEMSSLNRKHLDLQIFLPVGCHGCDPWIRTMLSQKLQRGQVSLRISLAACAPQVNLDEMIQVKKSWETVAQHLNDPPGQVNLSFLLTHSLIAMRPHVDEDLLSPYLREEIERVLAILIEEKYREGKVLFEDVERSYQKIKDQAEQISSLAPQACKRWTEKYKQKVEQIFLSGHELEEKILREVSLFAEKVDISEELVRLQAHLTYFHQLMEESPFASGKKIEFLLQEMNRELNTMSSKAADASISQCVVEAKSELEKIKEQIQNVE